LDGRTLTPQQVDAAVQQAMQTAHVTGAGVAIFNHGKVVYLKAYGVRDADKRLPLTPDSVMTAASLTKAAFATMVMQLVHARSIDLDKPIVEYLPKPLPDYESYKDLAVDPRYKLITMRMLLGHTSGFANWRWLSDDKKLRIYFTPGSRFGYSGEGIDLAQLVVETVTKKSIGEVMHTRLFEPLGMSRTSMVSETQFENDHANRFDEQEHALGLEQRHRADAAGSMQTTLRDYAKFFEAVLSGSTPPANERQTMLSAQVRIESKHEFPSLATETTTANRAIRLSYGLGWGLYWTPYGKAFFKEGHDEGWRHYVVGFEEPKAGVLIMTNGSNGEDLYSELLETLLSDSFTPLEWEGFKPPPDQRGASASDHRSKLSSK
jgi:CubicO group peptidase (beta-lactamase class C family)